MGKSGVFISYARKDGEALANELRERLTKDAPDIQVWQDRQDIEGGVGWWRQIEEALERVEFLVIVMTDAVLRSDITRKEWRHARQQGVCVYPVKGPGFNFSDPRVTRWMKKAHIYDLDVQWETFVGHLRGGCSATRVPFMSPGLPAGFVQRSSEFGQLRSLLLDPAKRDPIAITTALTGAGGFGKTTLASAICDDEDIILAFDDGILWTTLGEKPNVLDALAKLYAGLTGERPEFKDAEDAETTLAEKLEHKNCLIVIDDVWDPAHLKYFLRGGSGCARLITSRQIEVAIEAKAKRVSVDEMTSEEAVAMLTAKLDPQPGDLLPFRNLAHQLGEWPLLLKLAAGAISQRLERGATLENALAYVNNALSRGGVTALDRKSETGRHAAVASTLEASLIFFDAEARRRYAELAVLPEDELIPLQVIAELWHLDEFETERFLEKLANASLLELDLRVGMVQLHDVLRTYLRSTLGAGGLSKAHETLLESWGNLRDLPHEYAWRWIGYHLEGAGRQRDLEALLLDFDWLRAKLEATEIDSLVREFDHASGKEELLLLQSALRLSSHVLARSKPKLAGQLLARLPEGELQQSILSQALKSRETWLRPLRTSLTQPGGPLLRTLEGHRIGVFAVALTADGKRAVSGSEDETLKVWDLESGRELRTLEGHTDSVSAVALTADGKRAVSGSRDKTLKVWDLERGRELRTLEGHTDWVNAVALTADGKRAVSGSYDETLKVWDLKRGRELRTLEGHTDRVFAVVLTADRKRAVSASSDCTAAVWNVEAGELIASFGADSAVYACAVASDTLTLVAGDAQGCVHFLRLENGS